ncbi:MAG TPA: permease prefix domain 1-containing protein [Microbacterium sp.]|uniref:permease prefix domain 1-containing protein n=1 Tax=Microbacterium sp. TaxID=51671 RepID=UPI002C0C998F|nr:permease prefix domain 1-containing protein [Microbacterium sp.]HWI32107.1 permease prefix domain 1-containing protein [Microbacterium sp.]
MTNLTERYVYAATRSVPEKNRADLTTELEASIGDAIDARVDGGEPRDAAERAVLIELGDPDKLAAGYTDRPLYLIGPRYYLEWWRLLKLLLWIVPVCAAFGISLGQVLSGASVGEAIGATVGGLLSVVVHLAFWVTLVFAILERTSGSRGEPVVAWDPDQLPEPRPKGLGFGDMVASLVFLAVAAAAIVWDRFIGFVWMGDDRLPVLNPDLWPWWIAGLFVLLAAEAGMAVAIYVKGRWTPAFAVLNAVLALAAAVPAIWLLATDQLLNPAFFTTVIPADSSAEVYSILSVVTGFGIAIIAGWDIIDGILKTVRSGRTLRSAP